MQSPLVISSTGSTAKAVPFRTRAASCHDAAPSLRPEWSKALASGRALPVDLTTSYLPGQSVTGRAAEDLFTCANAMTLLCQPSAKHAELADFGIPSTPGASTSHDMAGALFAAAVAALARSLPELTAQLADGSPAPAVTLENARLFVNAARVLAHPSVDELRRDPAFAEALGRLEEVLNEAPTLQLAPLEKAAVARGELWKGACLARLQYAEHTARDNVLQRSAAPKSGAGGVAAGELAAAAALQRAKEYALLNAAHLDSPPELFYALCDVDPSGIGRASEVFETARARALCGHRPLGTEVLAEAERRELPFSPTYHALRKRLDALPPLEDLGDDPQAWVAKGRAFFGAGPSARLEQTGETLAPLLREMVVLERDAATWNTPVLQTAFDKMDAARAPHLEDPILRSGVHEAFAKQGPSTASEARALRAWVDSVEVTPEVYEHCLPGALRRGLERTAGSWGGLPLAALRRVSMEERDPGSPMLRNRSGVSGAACAGGFLLIRPESGVADPEQVASVAAHEGFHLGERNSVSGFRRSVHRYQEDGAEPGELGKLALLGNSLLDRKHRPSVQLAGDYANAYSGFRDFRGCTEVVSQQGDRREEKEQLRWALRKPKEFLMVLGGMAHHARLSRFDTL